MFESLGERLNSTFRHLRGIGKLSEKNMDDTLRDIRMALLEADVSLPVVKTIVEDVKQQAIGQIVLKSLTPGQALVKIVSDVLTSVMGKENDQLNLQTQKPAMVLLAGLQGAGKTTTAAKLANWLKKTQKKSIMLASADIYRPAAIAQLQRLAEQVDVHFYQSESTSPVDIAKDAVDAAKKRVVDVLILDTAGRLHIDDEMMQEIKSIHETINPIETLFVVDSMTGQDAANTAKAFNDLLPLTGVILTKTDGDARGGAALSVRHITEKPIKFMGAGEKIDDLEPFHPERIASRILGMGDILTLVEEVEEKVDQKHAAKMAKKMQKGVGFNFQDFLDQLKQLRNMGGITKIMGKMPGMNQLPPMMKNQISDDMFNKYEAIINSMTRQERQFPALLSKGSRKKRIARGSGTNIPDINKLVKQFTQMQKMMKKFSRGGMQKMMKKMQGVLPPGSEELPF